MFQYKGNVPAQRQAVTDACMAMTNNCQNSVNAICHYWAQVLSDAILQKRQKSHIPVEVVRNIVLKYKV